MHDDGSLRPEGEVVWRVPVIGRDRRDPGVVAGGRSSVKHAIIQHLNMCESVHNVYHLNKIQKTFYLQSMQQNSQ